MSSGVALTGVENRCEPTTWMISPAVMYSLAFETWAKNDSLVTFESKGMERTSSGSVAGWCSAGCSSNEDRKSTRLNSSHLVISYAVFCLKKKKKTTD